MSSILHQPDVGCLAGFTGMKQHFSFLDRGYWVFRFSAGMDSQQDKPYRPVMVLANSKFLPITADYDLFAVCPYLEKVRLEEPHFHQLSGEKKFQTVVSGIQQLLGQRRRRLFHPQLGVISDQQAEVVEALNTRLAGCYGEKVVHHGPEMNNPFSCLDFPVSVFTPWREFLVVDNKPELEEVFRDLVKLGFLTYVNRCWKIHGLPHQRDSDLLSYDWNDRVEESDLTMLNILRPLATY
ncbi:hypothetical protein ACWJJH_04040 [Endozoicomonadaceae bacterium StTr2]